MLQVDLPAKSLLNPCLQLKVSRPSQATEPTRDAMLSSNAFTVISPSVAPQVAVTQHVEPKAPKSEAGQGSWFSGSGAALAATGLVTASALRRKARGLRAKNAPVATGLSSSVAGETYFRDQLVACRAQLNGVDAPTVEETDQHIQDVQNFAKQALAGAAAAMVFTSSMESAVAYPIFAQQNYANPREYTGKIVCANCHLAAKPIEVRIPQAVLPDTVFKTEVGRARGGEGAVTNRGICTSKHSRNVCIYIYI